MGATSLYMCKEIEKENKQIASSLGDVQLNETNPAKQTLRRNVALKNTGYERVNQKYQGCGEKQRGTLNGSSQKVKIRSRICRKK